MDQGQVQSLLHQLAAVQHRRSTLPDACQAELHSLAARERLAIAGREQATEASRARVEALLSGVPAPLLALAGQRASMQLTADQRLALECHLLSAEEAELRRQVSALEVEAAALEAREKAAQANLEAIPSELQRLQQQAADVKSADDLEVLAAEAVIEASLRTVREASQAEMERVLGSWEVLEGQARAAAAEEVAAELAAVSAACQAQLASFTEAARGRTKAAAEALADAASAEYAASLAPLLARLQAAQAASTARATHLTAVRDHCAAVLRDMRSGLHTGEDVWGYAETFPACSRAVSSESGSSSSSSSASAVLGVLQDPLGSSEARDAAELGFSPEAARGEFSGLLDGVLSTWAGGSGGSEGAGEAGAFLRELLAVVASGCEPVEGEAGSSSSSSSSSRAPGLDIVAEVRAEAARLASMA